MVSRKPSVGILALQGDFVEHAETIRKLGYPVVFVRTIFDLQHADGLIMPGGESTTIGKQLKKSGLHSAILKRAHHGFPVYGTCAGCILIANKVDSSYSLRLIDIAVKRNAYGRQLDSFEAPLRSRRFPGLHGVFIRSPRILNIGRDVDILAWHGRDPVLVQHENIIASTFHPELTEQSAIHRYFISLVERSARSHSPAIVLK